MSVINMKEIKEFNLSLKKARVAHLADFDARQHVIELLKNPAFKAVTVCFSDIEGRLHMLDYDKDFLLKSHDNLTFDGSSIRGFTTQHESDLKIQLDWAATYVLPFEIFGDGKLFIFGEIHDKDGTDYSADIRSILRTYLYELYVDQGIHANVAAEIEGFLFNGPDLEKTYNVHREFPYITTGGYFNTLPNSPLRQFINSVADAQRSAGFENEKDHPEVAPSQFEVNWSYTEALVAADQMQLYKMICRQIAANSGLTACFLPKPIIGVNGNGMHTNISFTNLEDDKNRFFGEKENNLSQEAWDFLRSVLNHGEEICLALNPSVNAYRRLDPAYEAPNEIKASAVDRGSMIRIPIGNERSARIEVRTVAPDANPYLVILSILKAGLAGKNTDRNEYVGKTGGNSKPAILPSDIYTAIDHFRESKLMKTALGLETHAKYIGWKEEAAVRCPRKLGTSIKAGEIMYHHEVTNQQLWSAF